MASDREKIALSSAGSGGGWEPARPAAPSPSLWSLIAGYRATPQSVEPEPESPDLRNAAPAATLKPAPRPPDDFQMISGLDARHAVWLGELGFRWYSEIAAWTAADVATVRSVLRLNTEIGRFGWIEQASVLASGQLTEFARRRTHGIPADPIDQTAPAGKMRKSTASTVALPDRPVVLTISSLDNDEVLTVVPAAAIEMPPAVDALPRSRARVAEIDSTVEGIVTAVAALTSGRAWAAHLAERARAELLETGPDRPLPVDLSPRKPAVQVRPVPLPPVQYDNPVPAEHGLPRVRLIIDGEPIARYADDYAGPATGIEIDPDWTPASRKRQNSASAIGGAVAAVSAPGTGGTFTPYVEPLRKAAAVRATVIASTIAEATVSIITGGPASAARAIAAAAAGASIEGLFPKPLSAVSGITEDQFARIRRFLNALTGEGR